MTKEQNMHEGRQLLILYGTFPTIDRIANNDELSERDKLWGIGCVMKYVNEHCFHMHWE